ncbi:hypothetical protein ACQKWADRAFT_313710 [Trichoderma austrokoningii]
MSAKNPPSRLCPHIEDRDLERKEFRDQFKRELAERKTFDEHFLCHLGERKKERKTVAPSPPPTCTQPEEETVQLGNVEQVGDRLAADILDQEIRQHKFMAEVEEIRKQQDQLYEKMDEELKKVEEEAAAGKGGE